MLRTMKSLQLITIFLVPLIFLPSISNGLDVYIDKTNGKDSNECQSAGKTRPCQTLAFALRVLDSHSINVTFHVAPANYILTQDPMITVIKFAQDVHFLGSPNGSVIVRCDTDAGLAFLYSVNISIEHMTFMQCGATLSTIQTDNTSSFDIHSRSSSHHMEYRSAISFCNCTNIFLNNITVLLSNGLGLDIENSNGTVTVQYSNFSDNKVNNKDLLTTLPGGGGVAITMYGNIGSHYNLHYNQFLSNQAILGKYYRTYNMSNANLLNGNGGGLAIQFHGTTRANSFNITNCNFYNNSAWFGSGLMIQFADESHKNNVTVTSCTFQSNKCFGVISPGPPNSKGGGARVDFIHSLNVSQEEMNTVLFNDCKFYNNSAIAGGALSVVFSEVQESKDYNQLPVLNISNCTFNANTATGAGSAIYISVWSESLNGYLPTVLIYRSWFTENHVIVTHNATGIGSVYSNRVPVTLSGLIFFISNDGTAVVISGTQLGISQSARLHFFENTGHNGGAIALINKAWMTLEKGNYITFDSNKARIHGGAIYVETDGYLQPEYSESCFIRYRDRFTHPKDWNATIIFFKNTAADTPNSIYTPSLLSCVWAGSQNSTLQEDIKATLCWNWQYKNSTCADQIRTSGSYYSYREDVIIPSSSSLLQMSVYPGREAVIPIIFYDDKNNTISSVFSAQISGDSTFVSEYVSNGLITIYGQPGHSAHLFLDTLSPRIIQTEINVTFWSCPPGFEAKEIQNKYQCRCSNNYHLTVICHSDDFTSYIKWGYFMTLNEETNQTLVAPWVVYSKLVFIPTLPGYSQLPGYLENLNDNTCGNIGRTGFLCGECLPNNSAPVYSYTYKCVSCDDNEVAINWLYFILLTFVPITIFFAIVVLFNISTTSGPANAFIFFAQLIANPITITRTTNQLDSVLNGTGHYDYIPKIVQGILIIPYGIWNLDFFQLIVSPFCIAPRIKAMHAYALNYTTAFYPLVLILFCFICIELHARGCKLVVCLWKPFSCCVKRVRNNWDLRASVIDAFATFLLLSYTKFCLLTSYLLVPVWAFDSEGKRVGDYRLFFDLSVIYMGNEHKPFFILALLVLIFVILPPPIFLLLYPTKIFQKLLNMLRIQGTALRMCMETFQGCYKDGVSFGTRDCRYFASLYFIFRILAFNSLVLSYDILIQRLLQIILTAVFILLFSLVRPYKDDFYNKLDSFILTVLMVIIAIGTYNAAVPNSFIFLNIILVIGMVIPLVYMIGYVTKNIIIWMKYFCRTGSVEYRPRLSVSVHSQYVDVVGLTDSAGSFPDRIINPEDYLERDGLRTTSEVCLNYGSTNNSN